MQWIWRRRLQLGKQISLQLMFQIFFHRFYLLQICSPACTELEVIVMDWLGKFLDLPKKYLNCSEGPGGGVIQGIFVHCIIMLRQCS